MKRRRRKRKQRKRRRKIQGNRLAHNFNAMLTTGREIIAGIGWIEINCVYK